MTQSLQGLQSPSADPALGVNLEQSQSRDSSADVGTGSGNLPVHGSSANDGTELSDPLAVHGSGSSSDNSHSTMRMSASVSSASDSQITVDLPAGHDSPFTDWNKNDATPCRFPDPRVVGIAVSGKNLRGYIPSELGTLIYLRSLNLHNNNFYGSILGQLFNETLLHSLFLYGNDLSGSLPPLICNLPMLQNLDLSNNSLSGSLPENLKNCKQLQRLILAQNKELNSLSTTLNLSYNHLSGKLSKTLGDLPVTVSFDLRNNNLSSEIPKTGSFANQGLTTFLNNPLLYGFPLQKPCTNSNISLSGTQSSSRNNLSETQKKGLGPGLILLISAADAAGLDFLRLIIVYIYWKRKDSSNGCSCTGKCKFDSENEEHEKGERSAKGEGELVAIDKWFNIELDELLRASTYVLGKSGLGIVYKMVLGNGVPVAVRRLGEGGLDQQRYREFAAEV
ncbi:hypothetical protein GOBAR_DD27240 [Gossypium barbadense]|nr:hypothetical protein GOBAR_DD27240 [Gossypium barbadense]